MVYSSCINKRRYCQNNEKFCQKRVAQLRISVGAMIDSKVLSQPLVIHCFQGLEVKLTHSSNVHDAHKLPSDNRQ